MKYVKAILAKSVIVILLLLTVIFAAKKPATAAGVDRSFAVSFVIAKHCAIIKALIDFSYLCYSSMKEAVNAAKTENNSSKAISDEVVIERYVVVPGDSLYRIARRHGITVRELMEFNSLNTTIIHPGQVLKIPNNVSQYGLTSRSADMNSSRPRIPYTHEEFDLLARLISAEARGESYTAQVAVGAVVINRVLSPKFPNTIKGVIYQKGQFGPVRNGHINRPAASSSISAAKEALYGRDPTNGALFFTDINSMNRFFHTLPVAYRDGRMIFFYSR